MQGYANHAYETPFVNMERDYLKAYKVFDEEVQKISPRLI